MKKLIMIAVALVLVGAVVCGASVAAMGFDFTKLDNGKYETNTYAVKEDFRNIAIGATVEKIAFKPSEDKSCKVVCFEEERMKHSVTVSDGTLTVELLDGQKLADHFLFNFKTPEITVYLPEDAYAELGIKTDTGDVEIPADFSFDRITVKGDTADVECFASAKDSVAIALTTGDIHIANIRTGALELKTTTGRIGAEAVDCAGDLSVRVDTGKTHLQDVTCRNLISEGTTGDLTLDNVVAADTINIERDTGDVEFRAGDAETIFVKTSTGDVTGTLSSEKVFLTETQTGKVEVPKSINGGRCEIYTDTGDVKIETP